MAKELEPNPFLLSEQSSFLPNELSPDTGPILIRIVRAGESYTGRCAGQAKRGGGRFGTSRTRLGRNATCEADHAAVVGILGAALYNPVWVSAVISPYDFASAAAGFILLTVWRAPPIVVVMLVALLATAQSLRLASGV